MTSSALAKRYARSLADVAGGGAAGPSRAAAGKKAHSSLEAIAAELRLAAEVVAGDPRLLRFFDDPSVGRTLKDKAIASLGKEAKLSELARRFLGVLVENRRMAALPAIARAFETIKDDRLGIVAAEATTAVALSAAEQKRLRESLETMTGRTVRLALRVDPAVIGGARTRIGSKVYDGTLKRRLAALRDRLVGTR
ncbi:MAG: ATP synthase F1 subunit delta [Candidatus Rokuibacteriota bacterium]